MKRVITLILTIACIGIFSVPLFACGNDDSDGGAESVDGKYYLYGEYHSAADGDEEEGFIEISNGKCRVSLDDPAREFDYSVDGNHIQFVDDEEHSFRVRGGVINNGVIIVGIDDGYYPVYEYYAVYCKQGKTPNDIFKNTNAYSGKYYEYIGKYWSIWAIDYLIAGDAFISRDSTGKVSKNGDNITFTPKTKTDRSDLLITRTFTSVKNVVLTTDNFTFEDGTELDGTYNVCKLGYSPSGDFDFKGEHIISFDGNGGGIYSTLAWESVTYDGRLDAVTYPWSSDGGIEYIYLPTPSRYGYKFTGYNTKPDGSGEALSADTVFTKDAVLYAQWEKRA